MPVGSRLRLSGEYDVWRRDELRTELDRVDLTDDVTIDMGNVALMDAGAAALLISLKHRLIEKTPGARVILVNAPRIVRRVIEICGAAELFDYLPDR